ncbi:hypothetical protein YC2023_016472 [Brassica napus]
MKDLKLGGIGVFFIYLFHSVVVLWGTESDLVLSFVELIPVVSGESKLIFSLGAHSLKLPVTICCISIGKDSIQPQVPLRLPCYDFTPVEDPTVVCVNKTTKSLCVTSVTQKCWVIIVPMLRAKPIPRV